MTLMNMKVMKRSQDYEVTWTGGRSTNVVDYRFIQRGAKNEFLSPISPMLVIILWRFQNL